MLSRARKVSRHLLCFISFLGVSTPRNVDVSPIESTLFFRWIKQSYLLAREQEKTHMVLSDDFCIPKTMRSWKKASLHRLQSVRVPHAWTSRGRHSLSSFPAVLAVNTSLSSRQSVGSLLSKASCRCERWEMIYPASLSLRWKLKLSQNLSVYLCWEAARFFNTQLSALNITAWVHALFLSLVSLQREDEVMKAGWSKEKLKLKLWSGRIKGSIAKNTLSSAL